LQIWTQTAGYLPPLPWSKDFIGYVTGAWQYSAKQIRHIFIWDMRNRQTPTFIAEK
jgi:hypothetical protein